MKVLLVKPYNLSDHIQPSLGLGYLATAIRDRSEVHILDCIKDNIKLEGLRDIVLRLKPDLVGMQCYTFDLRFVKDALKSVKEINAGIVTAIGGPHPSALPLESMEYFGENLDFLFCGEAERSFQMLVDLLKQEKDDFTNIPGLVYRAKGSLRINQTEFIQDLDTLGLPAWDLIHPETYPEAQHGAFFKNFPIAPIMLTRGCPYLCTFCAGKVVGGRKLRKRSIPHVIGEIKLLYHEYGIREFHFVDDNFSLDTRYAKDFLRALLAQNLDISWATPNGVRLDSLDDELLGLMKQSGLYLISLGIESGSDRILKAIKKDLTVEKVREGIRLIRKHKIDVAGFFILGFPNETREDIKKTISFSLELDLVRANFFNYLPFPGTESYRQLTESGEIDSVDWERLFFTTAAYVPRGLSRANLKWLQREAFFRFYSRPRILVKNLASIRSLRHFKFLLKRFFRWIIAI